jgi:excisionase family DNA binding protein
MEYRKGIIKNTEFFTTAELAEKLKMNVQVITRKVQGGEIKAYKIGKDWRIPEQAVFQWLEERSNQKSRKNDGKGARPGELRDMFPASVPIEQSQCNSPDKVPARVTASKNNPFKMLGARRSSRKYLLEYILAQFVPGKLYTEEQVDKIVARYHDDTAVIRREFLAEKMMERVNGRYRRLSSYRFSD